MTDRDRGDPHYEKAQALRKEGKIDDALEELGKALNFSSKAEYHIEAVQLFLAIGDIEEADSSLRTVEILVEQKVAGPKVDQKEVDRMRNDVNAKLAPIVEHQNRIRDAADSKNVDALISALTSNGAGLSKPVTRQSVRLHSAPGDAEVGQSKLGGEPDLPEGTEWPHTPAGNPLSFICQLNLSKIEMPPDTKLGARGMLYFFYNADAQPWGFDPADRGHWKVIHAAEPGKKSVEPPEELSADYQFPEAILTPRMEATLPDWADDHFERDNAAAYIRNSYSDALDLLYGEQPWHRLFGFPQIIQNPMEIECQLVSHGYYMGGSELHDEPSEALIAGADKWHLLLQVDSDEDADFLWGDMGRLYFWIRDDDLEQGNFDDVWLILQCT